MYCRFGYKPVTFWKSCDDLRFQLLPLFFRKAKGIFVLSTKYIHSHYSKFIETNEGKKHELLSISTERKELSVEFICDM